MRTRARVNALYMWEGYWGQKWMNPRVTPPTTNDSNLLVLIPLSDSFSVSADRTCGLLITNRTWQWESDVTSTAVLYYMAKMMGTMDGK